LVKLTNFGVATRQANEPAHAQSVAMEGQVCMPGFKLGRRSLDDTFK
jgi:hypothetical protein